MISPVVAFPIFQENQMQPISSPKVQISLTDVMSIGDYLVLRLSSHQRYLYSAYFPLVSSSLINPTLDGTDWATRPVDLFVDDVLLLLAEVTRKYKSNLYRIYSESSKGNVSALGY